MSLRIIVPALALLAIAGIVVATKAGLLGSVAEGSVLAVAVLAVSKAFLPGWGSDDWGLFDLFGWGSDGSDGDGSDGSDGGDGGDGGGD